MLRALCPEMSPDLVEMPQHTTHLCYEVYLALNFVWGGWGLKGHKEGNYSPFSFFPFPSFRGAEVCQPHIGVWDGDIRDYALMKNGKGALINFNSS